jgi:hypothetical protein
MVCRIWVPKFVVVDPIPDHRPYQNLMTFSFNQFVERQQNLLENFAKSFSISLFSFSRTIKQRLSHVEVPFIGNYWD